MAPFCIAFSDKNNVTEISNSDAKLASLIRKNKLELITKTMQACCE